MATLYDTIAITYQKPAQNPLYNHTAKSPDSTNGYQDEPMYSQRPKSLRTRL